MVLDKFLNKVLIGVFIAVMIIALILGIRLTQKGRIENLNYQFDGVVDSVSYDIKGYATITVKGSHYYLGGTSWDFNHNRIQKGDSILKKRNSMIVKLIKPDGRIIFQGKDDQ